MPEKLYTSHKNVAEDLEHSTAREAEIQKQIEKISIASDIIETSAEEWGNTSGRDRVKLLVESADEAEILRKANVILKRKCDELTDGRSGSLRNTTKQKLEDETKYNANLWESQQHFRQNEEAYKQQATSEAQAAGKDILYPSITGPVAPPNLEGAPENGEPNLDQLERVLVDRRNYLIELRKEIDSLGQGEYANQKEAEYQKKNAEYFALLDEKDRLEVEARKRSTLS